MGARTETYTVTRADGCVGTVTRNLDSGEHSIEWEGPAATAATPRAIEAARAAQAHAEAMLAQATQALEEAKLAEEARLKAIEEQTPADPEGESSTDDDDPEGESSTDDDDPEGESSTDDDDPEGESSTEATPQAAPAKRTRSK